MYREGGTPHIKDVFDLVLVIGVVRIRLVALGLVDELAELARRWRRRVELCNQVGRRYVRKTVASKRRMSSKPSFPPRSARVGDVRPGASHFLTKASAIDSAPSLAARKHRAAWDIDLGRRLE